MVVRPPPAPLIALKLMIKTRLDYEKNAISVRTKLVTVSRRLVGEIAMSARPGRSKGRVARRIIGAGGAVGALPECGMASPAVAPPARADVIDDSLDDLDAFDFVGGGTFDTLGGSTAALFGDAWGVLQSAVAGPDCFAAINTDLPLTCQALLDPINDFSAQLPGRDLIGKGGVVGSAGQGGSGGLIGLAGSVCQKDLGGVGGNGGAGGEGSIGTAGADSGPRIVGNGHDGVNRAASGLARPEDQRPLHHEIDDGRGALGRHERHRKCPPLVIQ